MEERPLRIVCVGECTSDYYIDANRIFIGGISLNFAIHAKRSGANVVSLATCVGEDYSEPLIEKLKRERIDTSTVSIQKGATARQNIILSKSGERIFPTGGYEAGVLQNYQLNPIAIRFLQDHDVLVCALFKQVENLFLQVMRIPFSGWKVADFLDLSDYGSDPRNIESYLNELTLAFISGNMELVERLRPFSKETRCLMIVTLGANGSVALVNGEPVHEPSMKVEKVVDTTGCGDAFGAAFTVSYWRHGDARLALQAGARQASQVIQYMGASD